MDGPRVRFILTEINESELKEYYAYYIFEPTVALEIEGKNVFEEFGDKGVKHVIIASFIEDSFGDCKRMAGLFEKVLSIFNEGEYSFHFVGTGVSIELKSVDHELEVFLSVWDGGPIGNLKYGTYPLGRITVRDWVRAIVDLAKDVKSWFRRYNPRVHAVVEKEWIQIEQLESWLIDQQN